MLFGGWRGRINTGEHSVSSQQSHQQRRLQSSLLHGVSCLCREHSVLRPVEVVGGQRQLCCCCRLATVQRRGRARPDGRIPNAGLRATSRGLFDGSSSGGRWARLDLFYIRNRQTSDPRRPTDRTHRATGGIRE